MVQTRGQVSDGGIDKIFAVWGNHQSPQEKTLLKSYDALKASGKRLEVHTRTKALNAGAIHKLLLCMPADFAGAGDRLDSVGKIRLISGVCIKYTLSSIFVNINLSRVSSIGACPIKA